jgi:PAS domain S-box-containing protein
MGGEMSPYQRDLVLIRGTPLIAITALLAVAIFVVDLSLPLGVAGGVPYVAAVMMGWWFDSRKSIYRLAGLSTGLVIVGYLFSPEGGIEWVVLSNRGLALFAVWVTAALLVRAKDAKLALRSAHDNLAKRVEERAADLRRADEALREETGARAQAEGALGESQDRLKLITDNIPVLISYIDKDGRFRFNNRLYEDWYGIPRDRLYGRHIRDVFGTTRYGELEGYVAAALSGQTVDYEDRVVFAGGKERVLSGVFVPHVGDHGEVQGVFTLVADVTARTQAEEALRKARDSLEQRVKERTAELERKIEEHRRAEAALRDSEAALAKSQRIARVAHWVWDEVKDELSSYSDGLPRVLGVPPEHLRTTAKLCFGLIHPDDQERYQAAILGAAKHAKGYDIEFRTLLPDGEVGHIRESAEAEFDDGGRFVRTVGTLQDITEQKRAEEALRESREALKVRVAELEAAQETLEKQGAELARLADDLRVARDDADTANRAKSEFLALMSHELRTPLNAIIGFSDIIKNEFFGSVGNTQYRDYADDIHASGQHLLALINDILDLSKVESGTDDLHEADIEISRLVSAVLMMVRPRAESDGIALEVDLPDDLPGLWADELKLKQILINPLTNAVKFTDAGGTVTLKVWCRQDSGFVFQITDTGVGIAAQDIGTALSRFGQVDSPMTRSHEGTGLGLPLAKALAELHGGTFDLQSELGVGTTVMIRFPAVRIMHDRRGPGLRRPTSA